MSYQDDGIMGPSSWEAPLVRPQSRSANHPSFLEKTQTGAAYGPDRLGTAWSIKVQKGTQAGRVYDAVWKN